MIEEAVNSLDKHHRFVSTLRLLLTGSAMLMLVLLLVWPQLAKRADLISSALKNAASQKKIQASIDMTKVQFVSEDEKGQPFTISSDQITQIDAQNKIVQLENPRGEMTFSSGLKLFSSSPEALFYETTQIVNFKKLVDVLFDNGYQAQTSDVVVDYKNKTAYGKKPLSVRGEKFDLDSTGFDIRQNGNEMDFSGPVRVALKSPEKNVVILAQKSAEVRQKTQTITAFEKVISDDGINKVYCEELTAYFNQTGKNQYELRSVQAQRNVKIKTPTEEITGNEAYYDMIKEKAFITGNVVVKRAEGTVNGDRAIIDMKNGTSQIETDASRKDRVKGTLLPLQLKKKE
ncbi:MAG: LptA/OstA family protein [Alphaproteobacteria bacterium]